MEEKYEWLRLAPPQVRLGRSELGPGRRRHSLKCWVEGQTYQEANEGATHLEDAAQAHSKMHCEDRRLRRANECLECENSGNFPEPRYLKINCLPESKKNIKTHI